MLPLISGIVRLLPMKSDFDPERLSPATSRSWRTAAASISTIARPRPWPPFPRKNGVARAPYLLRAGRCFFVRSPPSLHHLACGQQIRALLHTHRDQRTWLLVLPGVSSDEDTPLGRLVPPLGRCRRLATAGRDVLGRLRVVAPSHQRVCTSTGTASVVLERVYSAGILRHCMVLHSGCRWK